MSGDWYDVGAWSNDDEETDYYGNTLQTLFHVIVTGASTQEMKATYQAVNDVANALRKSSGNSISADQAFRKEFDEYKRTKDDNLVLQPLTINFAHSGYVGGITSKLFSTITIHGLYEPLLYSESYFRTEEQASLMNFNLIVHELGHRFNHLHGERPQTDVRFLPNQYSETTTVIPGLSQTTDGTGEYMWMLNRNGNQRSEAFADMFVGWVYGNYSVVDMTAKNHMNTYMPRYLWSD